MTGRGVLESRDIIGAQFNGTRAQSQKLKIDFAVKLSL